MKTKFRISGYILRSGLAALFVSLAIVALSSAINLPNDHPTFRTQQNDNIAFGVNGHESAASLAASAIQKNRTLTFSDRVAYQRAIEEVYWQHRIWPKENTSPKPPLDKMMTQAEIEKKVEDYLRNSQALEDYWQRPITPDQLQAEMERIASHTKQAGVLRELFAALGNDPFVIAECLARPVLAERLITELYAHDPRFHGELKRRAEAELRTHGSLKQMKQTTGMYTEMEWMKSEDADLASSDAPGVVATPLPATPKRSEGGRGVGLNVPQARGYSERHDEPGVIRMNGSEWQESVEKLAKDLGNTKGADAWTQIKTSVLSPLQEDEGHYYAVTVMKKGKDRLRLATIAWLKEPLRTWLAKAQAQVPVTMAAVSANYTLPVISGQSDNLIPSVACTDDTWIATGSINPPTARSHHTAVWIGTEMIVWGGDNGITYFGTGRRYNPTTESWTATSTALPAPAGRSGHTAVWTGTEMIVWGGYNGSSYLSKSGRYNPRTDSWIATSTTNAPAARSGHTAVWTGSEMIVWGGGYNDTYLNTGGRYNPNTNIWTATSTTNAPTGRYGHTAVWTGSEMIVWGGTTNFEFFFTGGRYNPGTANPGTDRWIATSTRNAPTGRYGHTAVWTGSEMIVWGGAGGFPSLFNTGARYNPGTDPGTDSWVATGTTNAPSARTVHTAVWTGSEMIVWGGSNGSNLVNTGGRYNPGVTPPPIVEKNGADAPAAAWTATSIINAPVARVYHTAVWTGSEMIVWGGAGPNTSYLNSGGKYCAPPAPTPTPTPTPTATPTPTPAVTTKPATFIASHSAKLNGSVNPHGLTTTVYFQYGTTTSYGLTTATQSKSGNTSQNVAANISGLTASTAYHFRIVAINSAGTVYGSDRTFTTLSATGAPVVITNPATNVAGSSATLNGSVDPHGFSTTVYFQYGTTTSYGSTTANQTKTGDTYQNVAANISGLTASTIYHFRIVATNSAGTRYGGDRTFTTP